MKNVDIFRATISELEHGDEQFNIDRDRLWISDRVAMMVQDWGMIADDFREEQGYGVLNIIASHWRDMGLVLCNWPIAHLTVDHVTLRTIVRRIFKNEGANV